MKTSSYRLITPLTGSARGLIAGLSLALITTTGALADDHLTARAKKKPQAESKVSTRSPDEALRAGLAWLAKEQQPDGGWGQGGGWRQNVSGGGRVEGKAIEDPSDVGNTCVSLMAVLRADAAKENREPIRKAFDFICRHVEKSDDESLYVTPVRDTQLQVKIGAYVDTFLTGWVLSELKGQLDDEAAEKRRAAALDKVVAKIERNQRADGSFDNNKGWAAVLSQGLCSKALNAAARTGAKVSKEALDKDQKQNLAGLDVEKGDFSPTAAPAEPSSAGISLYREAAKLGGLRAKTLSNVARKTAAEKIVASPSAPAPEKAKARDELKLIEDDQKAAQVAQSAVAGKLGDTRYVAGFGNNGGEEFLSYLNLGESMHERGGKEWETWKGKMETTLCSAQNEDGSWAGHHCITGRTFCTATALLTMLVERTPAAKTTRTDAGENTVANVAR